jgi:hypothetical protein
VPLLLGTGISAGAVKRKKKEEEPQRATITPPLEAQARNIALGYRDAGGALPGPMKMADLLGTALASFNDRASWRDFFSQSLVESLTDPERLQQFKDMSAEDVLYRGDIETEEPLIDRVVFGEYSPFGVLREHAFFERGLAEAKAENVKLPQARSVEEIAAKAEGHEEEMAKFFVERGLVPEDSKNQFGAGLQAWSYAANLADAVIKNDADAILAVQRTGLIDPGLTPRQALTQIHPNSDDLKNYVFQNALAARHPAQNEYDFLDYYRLEYGAEWLPQHYQELLNGNQQGGIWEDVLAPLKYVIGQDNPEADAVSDYLAKNVDGFEEYDAGVTALADSLNQTINPFAGDDEGSKYMREKGTWALNLPTEYGNRGIIAVSWMAADILRKSAGREWWDSNQPLLTQFAEDWKKSKGKMSVAEWLEMADMEPADHPLLNWTGQLIVDTALGGGLDMAVFKLGGAALGSTVGRSASKNLGARSSAELMAESKNPFVIRDTFEGLDLTPEEAVHLADDVHTADDVMTWFDERGKMFAMKQDFDPSFPSVRISNRYKWLTDKNVDPSRRALFMPEDTGPISLSGRADQRVYQYMLHAGVRQKDALDWAAKVTRAQGGTAEARKATDLALRDVDRYLKEHLSSHPCPPDIAKKLKMGTPAKSDSFKWRSVEGGTYKDSSFPTHTVGKPEAVEDMAGGVRAGEPTGLDAYEYIHSQLFAGKKVEHPASAYAPDIAEPELARYAGEWDDFAKEHAVIIDDVEASRLEREVADAESREAVAREALTSVRTKLRDARGQSAQAEAAPREGGNYRWDDDRYNSGGSPRTVAPENREAGWAQTQRFADDLEDGELVFDVEGSR